MPQVFLYLGECADELRREAQRQERSLSWLLQYAWRKSRLRVRKLRPPPDPQAERPIRST